MNKHHLPEALYANRPATAIKFEQYWTTKEVAQRLRVSTDCVKKWLSSGKLAKTKAGGKTLVTETALQNFLLRSTEAA